MPDKRNEQTILGFGDEPAPEELEGSVDSVVFTNDEGSFSVFRLRPAGGNSRVSVTAPCAAPLVGQQVRLAGTWVNHPHFGQQFKARSLRVEAPSSAKGIERFLASGAVEGIGPAMAARIVKKFGTDALRIIEEQPHQLQEVAGIGRKTAEKIAASYRAQTELREIMVWLEGHGISGTFAARIFKAYSSFSLDVLQHHPYQLAREIEGIGFQTADAIAASLGVAGDDTERVAAGIDYALQQIATNGHCCIPEGPLAEKAAKLLGVPAARVRDVIQAQLAAKRLAVEYEGADMLIYPSQLYRAECAVAEKLLDLQKNAHAVAGADRGAALVAKWERKTGLSLAPAQRDAVASVLEHGVFVLTGGPGTGKTTVVRAMLDLLEEKGLSILLGAPTGRAAKRLAEATGRKAVTVHRMLEAQGIRGTVQFLRSEDEPLETDAVILDEVSMMDIMLMAHFLAAVPMGCRVVFVGDVDQLPAVGPGAVLKDILRSKAVPSVRLTEVFRQQGESSIVMNAHAINAGREPVAVRDVGAEFQFWELPDAATTAEKIVSLCANFLPQKGFSPLSDVQVLAPMHRQECGVDNLNRLLQEALNPKSQAKPEYVGASHTFRLGDKVMQTKNNYTKQVFNGDIGFITALDASGLSVRFGEGLVVGYERGELGELQLAYAMSVHKSQGSEYPVIVLPLVAGHRIMLQRNLLYTAVTRAREKVILLGSRAALRTAVENDRTKRRYTLLAERLARRK